LVVISNSGRTRDLMDCCDIARKNGATTIVITASGSPLASAGHIHLAADHPEGYDKLQPDGVAAAAPDDHRHSGNLHGRCALAATNCSRLLREMKNNLRSKRYT
jgi:RpiR family carbohydrate utilization transcriptional regulator